MIAPFRRACAAHRSALIDFADRREAGTRSAAALRHLERCRDCEARVAEFALAIAALRQLGADVQAAQPAADGWDRLKARIQASGFDPWRWRLTLGGLATSSMLVLVLIAPGSIGRPSIAEIAPAAPGPQTRAAARVEAHYIATAHATPNDVAEEDVSSDQSFPIYFPDQRRPGRKEVAATSSPGRPPMPI